MPELAIRVLERFVAHVAHTGLGDGGNCQRVSVLCDNLAERVQQRVDALLAPVLDLAMRGMRPVDERIDERKRAASTPRVESAG